MNTEARPLKTGGSVADPLGGLPVSLSLSLPVSSTSPLRSPAQLKWNCVTALIAIRHKWLDLAAASPTDLSAHRACLHGPRMQKLKKQGRAFSSCMAVRRPWIGAARPWHRRHTPRYRRSSRQRQGPSGDGCSTHGIASLGDPIDKSLQGEPRRTTWVRSSHGKMYWASPRSYGTSPVQ